MFGNNTTRWVGCILGMVMALGLAAPAAAHNPPGGPFADLQAKLAEIQMQLDNLQSDMTMLKDTVGNLPTEVDLRGVTQNWDKQLDSTNGDANGCNSDRFTCLFGDTAVRDNETGRVWERSPSTDSRTWEDGIDYCANLELGGRKGWALPMREELASLVDPSNTNPSLPTDHPFLNVQSVQTYLTSTTDAGDQTKAGSVLFNLGGVASEAKIGADGTWCVRGGQSFDGHTQ